MRSPQTPCDLLYSVTMHACWIPIGARAIHWHGQFTTGILDGGAGLQQMWEPLFDVSFQRAETALASDRGLLLDLVKHGPGAATWTSGLTMPHAPLSPVPPRVCTVGYALRSALRSAHAHQPPLATTPSNHPTRAVCCTLRSAHAHRMLIGACNSPAIRRFLHLPWAGFTFAGLHPLNVRVGAHLRRWAAELATGAIECHRAGAACAPTST